MSNSSAAQPAPPDNNTWSSIVWSSTSFNLIASDSTDKNYNASDYGSVYLGQGDFNGRDHPEHLWQFFPSPFKPADPTQPEYVIRPANINPPVWLSSTQLRVFVPGCGDECDDPTPVITDKADEGALWTIQSDSDDNRYLANRKLGSKQPLYSDDHGLTGDTSSLSFPDSPGNVTRTQFRVTSAADAAINDPAFSSLSPAFSPLAQKLGLASPTASPTPTPHGKPAYKVAGPAVGASFGAVLIIGLIIGFIFWRRGKRKQKQIKMPPPPSDAGSGEVAEISSTGRTPAELSSSGRTSPAELEGGRGVREMEGDSEVQVSKAHDSERGLHYQQSGSAARYF